MNILLVSINCPTENEMAECHSRLDKEFKAICPQQLCAGNIFVKTVQDHKPNSPNLVEITMKGNEAIEYYPVVSKYMRWYGA